MKLNVRRGEMGTWEGKAEAQGFWCGGILCRWRKRADAELALGRGVMSCRWAEGKLQRASMGGCGS
jgi:hypothetical protein